MRKHAAGFTLIELLVVVAIIAILLALLMPALDKAMYQAELAVCGARLHGIGTGVTTYAFDFKRNYPYRRLVRDWEGYEISPMNIYGGDVTASFDDRTPIRDYISINKMLNDPLCAEVNIEDLANPNSAYTVYSSYALWYGWQYRIKSADALAAKQQHKGLFKLGDSFEWDGDNYSLLAGDYSRDRDMYEAGNHPDKDGAWSNFVWQDIDNYWGGGSPGEVSGFMTWSWWGQLARGPLDLNFATADGAVRRFNDVMNLAPAGLRGVPTLNDNRIPGRLISVPAN